MNDPRKNDSQWHLWSNDYKTVLLLGAILDRLAPPERQMHLPGDTHYVPKAEELRLEILRREKELIKERTESFETIRQLHVRINALEGELIKERFK